MELKNGYKVLYEVIEDGKRTFYADKCNGDAAKQIGGQITIGSYKLVYERDGQIYGSTTGIPAEDDHCFDAFDEVFVCDHVDADDDSNCDKCAEEIPAATTYNRRSRKSTPVVEEPVTEEPEVTPVEE